MPTFSLAGNSALVTGFPKGIGLGLAHGLHAAGATTFLLSSAASFITGQIPGVDGGLNVGQIGRR
jgi:NAD(P)-dependent dehydrogenase (short-subunit alcohol dehydrogenase family)